ncbi:MAG TPA: hypothetical protein VHX11_10800 [Acidobacteriaceae bacterium]|jgi:hypothetical protein|nr:hypothetical protein [Acidobacteriaceae bacterium]
MENTFQYLRQFGPALAERILETYLPLQGTKDPVAPSLAALLRKALPAQALATTGTAKYLRKAKAARIVVTAGREKRTWHSARSICWRMVGPGLPW